MLILNAAVTVDLLIFTVQDGEFRVLLIERALDPFKGSWALPGGFALEDETLADAAERELVEETGIRQGAAHLEQLATYGDPGRDPRGRVVTVAHLALVPGLPTPQGGSDAKSASWIPVGAALKKRLAFDHRRILGDGIERARAKLEYSPLAARFCEETFTVAELRGVYEAVWGHELDPRNFHRKVTTTPDFLIPTGGTTTRNGGRPAQLFRLGQVETLHPPMLRPE